VICSAQTSLEKYSPWEASAVVIHVLWGDQAMDPNAFPVFVQIGVPAVSGVEGTDLGLFSEWISSWSVQGTDPAEGEPLSEGSVVNLVLRADHSPVEPPPFEGKILDVGGLDVDAAASMLQRLGYTTSFVTSSIDEKIPEPVVTGTWPSAGTFLPPPANVQINLSARPVLR
jgi:hypothetical protein